jgi:hypothetical protein
LSPACPTPGHQTVSASNVVKSATEPEVSKLVFVENWTEGLKAKMPTVSRAVRDPNRQ